MNPDSDVEWQDVVDLRAQYFGEPENRDNVRKGGLIIRDYVDAGYMLNSESSSDGAASVSRQTIFINADKTETSDSQFYIEDESKLRDQNYLLQLHNYDPALFEVVSAKNSKWNSNAGGGETKTLYSSKVTVKPKVPEVDEVRIKEWFDRLDRNYSKPSVASWTAHDDGEDKLLILPISDLHYALRSTVLETGEEYNCEIAERLFFDVISDVLSRTKQQNFEKIIFLIGGDQANSDNLSYTTTKGTPQDSCAGYFDMMERLYAMTVKAVDILADVAPVDVIWIPSNHDKTVGSALSHYVQAFFRHDSRVSVDTSPLPRKYIKYGASLFCFAHDGDMKRLPQLIADEARQYWSEVSNTEVFLQHLHSEATLSESYHMRVQRLPTISANSAWAVDKGYRSKRQCKSFVFDKDIGMTDVLYTVV